MPAPSYTESELRELNLPGFMVPARMDPRAPFSIFEDSHWQMVHNMSIVAHAGNVGYIATMIREPGNVTHENVVSTPTQRLTHHQAQEVLTLKAPYLDEDDVGLDYILPTFLLREVNPSRPAVVARYGRNVERLDWVEPLHPLCSLTFDLLKTKLGFEEPERAALLGERFGKVAIRRVLAGFSYVDDTPSGEPLYEPLIMLGTVLVLHEPGISSLPERTSEYRGISWVPLEGFADRVGRRAVRDLIWNVTDKEEIEVCVRGMCLLTSIDSTHAERELAYLRSPALPRRLDDF